MFVRSLAKFIVFLALLSGCSTDLKKLGAEQGRIAAGIKLPSLPDECKKQYGHAPIKVGDNPVIVLKRERQIVNQANKTIRLCGDNYNTIKAELETKLK